MKKGICVFLLLCVAFSLINIPSFAQSINESVLIHPLLYPDGSTITLTPDQEIVLGIGWAACTPGLVRAFLTSVQLEWTLNGQPVLSSADIPQYWTEIAERDPVPGSVCIAGNGTFWGSTWRYSLGELDPGTYQVHFLEWFTHPFIDGADNDGDGQIDLFSGVITDWSVTIRVEDPQ